MRLPSQVCSHSDSIPLSSLPGLTQSFLPGPGLRYKLINSMVTLQIKYRFPFLGQPRPQVYVTAFPDDMGHFALLGRAKRAARLGGGHVQFQCKGILGKADVFRRKGTNLDAPVGCQAIFFASVEDGTDAAAESNAPERDTGDGEHPVAALHGKEPEGAHDIGPQGREGTVADLAPDVRQPDAAFPPGKTADPLGRECLPFFSLCAPYPSFQPSAKEQQQKQRSHGGEQKKQDQVESVQQEIRRNGEGGYHSLPRQDMIQHR